MSPIILFSQPTSAQDVPTSVNIKPSLTLTIPENSISLVLDPASNAFASSAIHITVGTNNEKGYKLLLSTPDNNTELVNTVDSSKTIPTLPIKTGGYAESDFTVNKWGYKLGSGNYIPYVPNATIMENSTKANNDTTTLTFASKIDYEKPSGTYSTTLSFKTIPTVTSYYMQDLADSTIATTACRSDVPTIVFDSRDEQPYMIQRLQDGRCWMLDNLNLDLTDEKIVNNLSASNTNINITTDPNALDYLKNGGRTYGDRYPTAGLEYHNWTDPTSIPSSPNLSYSQPLVNRSGACKNIQWQCVGVWANTDYTYNTTIDKYGSTSISYDFGFGKYKIGTYYNYCAASAGTYCYGDGYSDPGTPPIDSTLSSDICPAGWHIPSDNNGNNGDYLKLCSAVKGSACNGASYNDMDITAMASLQYQLSIPLSGAYFSGSAYQIGDVGYFWSSTYYSDTHMRYLLVESSRILPQSSNYRRNGVSVRCVSS